MATFTIIPQKHKKLSNGDIPLMIRIIIDRKAIYSSLEIRIKLEQWDDKNKLIKKHPNAILTHPLSLKGQQKIFNQKLQ